MNTSYDGRLAASESLPTSPTITPEPLTVGATRTGGAREEILCLEAKAAASVCPASPSTYRSKNGIGSTIKPKTATSAQRMDPPVWHSSETSDEPESRAAEADDMMVPLHA